MKSKSVLLIEDNLLLSGLLKNKLGVLGIDVSHAANGSSARAFLHDIHFYPDLVILDLILPGHSGFELLKEIRGDARLAKVRVVVLSNLSSDRDKEACRKLGVEDFLVKAQISIDSVVEEIKTLLKI